MSHPQFAANTSVSVEKTRAEIETLLNRYGASRFGYMTDEHGARIVFEIMGRGVRFVLPLPSRGEKAFTHRPVRGIQVINTPEQNLKLWEQACRTRWRALLLCIRAKLEACAAKITTFESEFLAHIVLADGRTVGEAAIPQLTMGGPLLLS